MGPGTFKSAIYELSLYFERKPPRDETITQWCEEVRDIPENHIKDLLAEVKKLESWPRNLPAFMWAKSMEIGEKNGDSKANEIHDRRFHPDKWANPECPKCKGSGVVRTAMDWPMGKTEEGDLITKRINPPVLCSCTEKWESGG
ncbi:MAG: hypothetical protein WC356_01650 [Candidatus Micrarchaeia archaeon]|jgi:hypothetical protein